MLDNASLSTRRFSDRVENYLKYRPKYPPEIIPFLREKCGLTAGMVVADIGSGTGFLTELFLEHGNAVFAVEPNKEMREAGESYMQKFDKLTSIDGTAEATTLAYRCADFIVTGQAFHWFDLTKTRLEFNRILKPGGFVILIWNDRRTTSTPFLKAYEEFLLDISSDYRQVDHKNLGEQEFESFFGQKPSAATFLNAQYFDFAALRGRLLSSSYAPNEHDPRFPEAEQKLREIFEAHQVDGIVTFEYDTRVFYGRIR